MLEATAEARNTLLKGALSSNWDKLVTKINEAGIETDRFEEKLKSTAEAHGIDVDKLIKEHGSLEKAFRSGAISIDILKEAVKGLEGKLADLSGVTRDLKKGMKGDDVKEVQKALEKLGHSVGKAGIDGSFGKATQNAVKAFQEANGLKVTGIVDEKTLKALEEANGKAENLSESVGGLIANIDKLGGRELLIESLKNVFDALVSVVKPIKEAFREIFPPTTAEQLYSIIESFNKFTKKLILGDTASENLKRTFKGVFAVLDIGKQLISAVVKAISPLFGKVSKLSGGLLGFTGNIGDWLVSLDESIKSSNFFGIAIEKIGNALKKVKNFFQPVIEGAKKLGNEITKNVTAAADNVEERLGPLSVLGNFIKGVFVGLGKVIKTIFPYVSTAAQGIGNVLGDLMSRISDSIQNADYDSFFDLTSGGIIAAIGAFIAKFIKSGSDLLDNAGGFIEIKTDNDSLFAFTLEEIEALGLEKAAYSDNLHADGLAACEVTTEYEDKFKGQGLPIHYVRIEKTV
jgi:peptidoglycan hydrolase-like protein with peptidoglycan-binding domain